MADAVTSQTLFTGLRKATMAFTNLSDGTGEAAVTKVDISALPGAPSSVRIERVQFACVGMSVAVLFDHDVDDKVLELADTGTFCFKEIGGLKDPASAGGTGDILFTTTGHTLGDSYTVVLDLLY